MAKVYIDSTIHNDWNIEFNVRFCDALENVGISCYLPQRDTNQQGTREQIFMQNHDAINAAGAIIAIAKNESPNWGVEVGYAKGLATHLVILTENGHTIPLMAEFLADKIWEVQNLEDINLYIDDLIKLLK